MSTWLNELTSFLLVLGRLELVPLEYAIDWLTCVFASIRHVVLVSLPGAA